MSAGGLGIERIRLTAICTVCIKAFLKEIALMSDHLNRLGPVDQELASRLRRESLERLSASAHPLHPGIGGITERARA
jgi:hypothetical protein